ncbi:MAG: fatty acid desaturase [Rhodobacteraceae bacterium]|nr:fatty acid desaturase [Paracoccaceae bacterium]
MKALAGMDRHSRAMAWALVASYLALIAAAVGAGAWLLQQPQTAWTVAAILFLMLFIGTRIRGVNNIVHECSHATFSSDRGDNARIGRFCSSLLLGCYRDYCEDHRSHHMHLGDHDHDHDFGALKALRLEDPLTPRVVLRHIVTPLIGRHLPYYLRANLSAGDGRGWQVFKVALVAAVAVLCVLAPLVGLLFVVVPFALVYTAINYWTDCVDHGGIVANTDELEASRNVLAPAPLQVLLFPRYDCYHLVHHLFPHVPARHLAAAHRKLLAEEAYRARSNATGRVARPAASHPGWAPGRLARAAMFFSL